MSTDRTAITPAPDGEDAATTPAPLTPEDIALFEQFCRALAEVGRELREEAAALEADAAA